MSKRRFQGIAAPLALVLISLAPPVAAQSAGETITLAGAIRLVESSGGAVCSPGTTGPHDGFGARTIGEVLDAEGFHLPEPFDAGCGDRGVQASQPGTDDFGATTGCGVIYPVGAPFSRFEATYEVPAQRSPDETLLYTVTVKPPFGAQSNPSAHSFLNFVPHRNVAVPAPPPEYTVIPGEDFEMVPAVVRLSFRLEDGAHGSGDTTVWYGYGDAVPFPSYLTPDQIASTVLLQGAPDYASSRIISHGADTSTIPAADLPTNTSYYQGSDDYFIVPAGHTMTLSLEGEFAYTHPICGSVVVPTRDLIGDVAIDFDIDGDGAPDAIPTLGIFSVNIPVDAERTSCAFFPVDVVGETEVQTSALLFGGEPSGFSAGVSANGPLGDPVADLVATDALPKVYAWLNGSTWLDRSALPPTAPGFPFAGTAFLKFPVIESHELGPDGEPLSGAEATGFDTRPGYACPDGPVVPDQCVDFGAEKNTGLPFEPLVIEPAFVRGRVLLADRGTPIDQVSQIGPTLLDATAYYHDDPDLTQVIPNLNLLQSTVKTRSTLPSSYVGERATSTVEPVPPMDTNSLSQRFGQFFIDRSNNTTLASFELPVLDASCPVEQNPWRTDELRLYFFSGTPDASEDEDFTSGSMLYQKREPSSPTGPPDYLTPERVCPGGVISDQNFDVCVGLIRVTLIERGQDPNEPPGTPRKFFNPAITAVSQRGYLFDDPDPESDGSASEIGGPSVFGGFHGTPLNGFLFLPGTTNYFSYDQPPASRGRVNLIVPAGRYTLTGSYYLEKGGYTTLPSITGETGVFVNCGQVVSIPNDLAVSAYIPSCTDTGGFTLAGNAFSTPAPPGGPEEIAAAQVATISYAVDDGSPIVLDPTVAQVPPSPYWGLQPAFAVPLDLEGGPACAAHEIEITVITQAGLDSGGLEGVATTRSATVVDNGTAPEITACPSAPIVLDSCDQAASIPFNPQTLVTEGLLEAADDCPDAPLWSFSPNPGSFPTGTTTTIEATASDGYSCGNRSSCSFDVEVVCDATPPEIFCPDPITVTDADLDGFETVSFAVSTSEDCGEANLVLSHASPSAFPIGTTGVEATATNGCGLASSCEFDVTVLPGCTCDDGNSCTEDDCDPQTGECRYTPLAAGTACGDPSAGTCDAPDSCDGAGSCDPNFAPAGTACGDPSSAECDGPDACNGAGGCDANLAPPGTACTGDGNACTLDVCDAGSCGHPDQPDGTTCDDGDACTNADSCLAGQCAAGPPLACDDGIACTIDFCDSTTGCDAQPTAECPMTIGFYKRLCAGPHPEDELTQQDADCVDDSATFASIESVADICAVMYPDPANDKCEQAESQLMALLLNRCKGRVVDGMATHSICSDNTTVGDSIAEADGLLSDAGRTTQDCVLAQCETDEINTGSALGIVTIRLDRLPDGTPRLSWNPAFLDGEFEDVLYRVWRRRDPSAEFELVGEVTDLFFEDTTALPGVDHQYMLTHVAPGTN